MIFTPVFKKTLWFSFFCHMGAFFALSFSFSPGNNTLVPDVYFLRRMPISVESAAYAAGLRHFFIERMASFSLEKTQKPSPETGSLYSKPAAQITSPVRKLEYKEPSSIFNPAPKKPAPAIIFHPQIPYSLAPYFKDREAVHIELMFNVVQIKEASSVQVRRRVSSGNLEADLLSMRYISRYLSMQGGALPPGDWRTVKIDLSLK